jgi:hypothetical protein
MHANLTPQRSKQQVYAIKNQCLSISTNLLQQIQISNRMKVQDKSMTTPSKAASLMSYYV